LLLFVIYSLCFVRAVNYVLPCIQRRDGKYIKNHFAILSFSMLLLSIYIKSHLKRCWIFVLAFMKEQNNNSYLKSQNQILDL